MIEVLVEEKKLIVEIEFSNRTSMTAGKLLDMFLIYLVCVITVLIRNK